MVLYTNGTVYEVYLHSEAGSHQLLPTDNLVPFVLGLGDFTCPMNKQQTQLGVLSNTE